MKSKVILSLILATFLAILTRFYLLFSIELLPDANWAYYLIQTRNLIENFSLAIDDFPFIFIVLALLSKFFYIFSSDLENTIFYTVKLFDTIVPAFLWWIYSYLLYILNWKNDKNIFHYFLIAIIINFSIFTFFMMWNYMKMSFWLVLLGIWLIFLIKNFISKKNFLIYFSIFFLFLASITHISIFWTIILASFLQLFLNFDKNFFKNNLKKIFYFLWFLIIIFSIIYVLDYERFLKFFNFFVFTETEIWYFKNLIFLWIWLLFFLFPTKNFYKFFATISLSLIILSWFWFSFWVSQRLTLILYIFAILIFANFALNIKENFNKFLAFFILGIFFLQPWIIFIKNWAFQTITYEEFLELKEAKKFIKPWKNSIIVARHGAEWWALWIFKTKIWQSKVLDKNFFKYENVYFLKTKPKNEYFIEKNNSNLKLFSDPIIPKNSEIIFKWKYIQIAKVKLEEYIETLEK